MPDLAALAKMENPFVGPAPVSKERRLFGRERETAELGSLLVAKRIVLLFAPSGAGKTSLIQAAMLSEMRDRHAIMVLPPVRLAHRGDAGLPPHNRYVLSMLRSLEEHFGGEQLSDAELVAYDLARYFAERLGLASERRDRRLLLVVDQFEELFTLDPHDWDAKQAFMELLGYLLAGIKPELGRRLRSAQTPPSAGDADLALESEPPEARASMEDFLQVTAPPLWALFSMREDRVAELQTLQEWIPTAFAFRYRLDLLDRETALQAVCRPAQGWIEDSAAKKVVDDLRTIEVRDGSSERRLGRFVEPVQLQVVCRGLWEKVVVAKHRAVADKDVGDSEDKSEVDAALQGYFSAEVDRAARVSGLSLMYLRDWVESRLITAGGVRCLVMRDAGEVPNLHAATKSLIEGHLLRSDMRNDQEWIELSHDRLIAPVKESNAAWRQDNLEAFQLAAREWSQASGRRRDDLLLSNQFKVWNAARFVDENPGRVTAADHQYVEESRRTLKRKRQRMWLGISGALIVGLAAMLAGGWKISAEQVRADAEQARANLLSERAQFYRRLASVREMRSGDALPELLALYDGVRADAANQRASVERALRDLLADTPTAEAMRLGEHDHVVWSLQVTQDGTRMVAGSWDGRLSTRLIDAGHRLSYSAFGNGAEIQAVALDEPRNVVATAHRDGSMALWRRDGEQFERLSLSPGKPRARQLTAALFAEAGAVLITAGWDKTITLWDVRRPQAPAKLVEFGGNMHKAPIQALVALPGSPRTFFALDLDGVVQQWELPAAVLDGGVPARAAARRRVADHGYAAGLYSGAVDVTGRWLAGGDSAGFVHLFDLRAAPAHSGLRLELGFHGRDLETSHINAIAFAPDGRSFTSAGLDGYLLRWTLPPADTPWKEFSTTMRPQRFGRFAERLFSVTYVPGQPELLLVGGTRSIRSVDLRRGRGSMLTQSIAPSESGRWGEVSMDVDGTTLAARRRGAPVQLWHARQEVVEALPFARVALQASQRFVLHPEGDRLLVVSCSGELAEMTLQAANEPVPAPATATAPSAGDCSGAAPAVSSDGRFVAGAVNDVPMLWERGPQGWRPLALEGGPAREPNVPVISVAFDAAAKYLAVGDAAGALRLFSLPEPAGTGRWEPALVDVGKDVLALAFHPGGKVLATGGEDGFISEWSVPGLQRLGRDARSERSVNALAYAMRDQATFDDRMESRPVMMSGNHEGVLLEWAPGSLKEGQTVALTRASTRSMGRILLRKDGRFMLTGGDELLAWDFGTDSIVRKARELAQRQ
jgi:WD40 repeat protein